VKNQIDGMMLLTAMIGVSARLGSRNDPSEVQQSTGGEAASFFSVASS
jgi:hypothetical protein